MQNKGTNTKGERQEVKHKGQHSFKLSFNTVCVVLEGSSILRNRGPLRWTTALTWRRGLLSTKNCTLLDFLFCFVCFVLKNRFPQIHELGIKANFMDSSEKQQVEDLLLDQDCIRAQSEACDPSFIHTLRGWRGG